MYYLIGLQNSHKKISSDCRERHKTHMSAGSGTLVTIYCAMNALWSTIPPIFIFQMVLYRHESLRGTPTSYSVSSYPCGLMTLENYQIAYYFVKHIKDFKNYTINWGM